VSLVIRKEQLDFLASIPRRAFETSLVEHFFRYYPKDCARLGEAPVRAMIRRGIERATAHGYHTREQAGLYCNLILMLGAGFDRDPQIPWAVEQLDDLVIDDPLERMRRLVATALQYLRDSFGEQGGYMARALVRIREYDLASAPCSTGPQLETDLLGSLESFCPQKFRTQGGGPTRALIRLGVAEAARHGISGGPGLTVYIALMFMVGAGFDDDPIYPWAGAVLNDASTASEAERVGRLHRAAAAYVSRALSD
jgi:hypothetical protein